MTRILLCYPQNWAQTSSSQKSWIDRVEKTWKKAHPDEQVEVVGTWNVPDAETRSKWPSILSNYDGVVAIETVTDGKHVLDERASQIARHAIDAQKECWAFRDGIGTDPGRMVRVASLKPLASDKTETGEKINE